LFAPLLDLDLEVETDGVRAESLDWRTAYWFRGKFLREEVQPPADRAAA